MSGSGVMTGMMVVITVTVQKIIPRDQVAVLTVYCVVAPGSAISTTAVWLIEITVIRVVLSLASDFEYYEDYYKEILFLV